MLILEVIAQGPSYGYEIAQTVAGRSDGTFEHEGGLALPGLHRLERQKLLEIDLARGRRPAAEVLRADRGRAGRAGLAEAVVVRFAAGINGVLGTNRAGWPRERPVQRINAHGFSRRSLPPICPLLATTSRRACATTSSTSWPTTSPVPIAAS